MGTTLSANARDALYARQPGRGDDRYRLRPHAVPGGASGRGLPQDYPQVRPGLVGDRAPARAASSSSARNPHATARAAEAAFHDSLQMALHLYLINRGILITPFHNMTLCCPDTREEDVDRLLSSSTRRSASCSPYPARGRPEMHFADPRKPASSSPHTRGAQHRAVPDRRQRRAARQAAASRRAAGGLRKRAALPSTILGLTINGDDVEETGLVWDVGDADAGPSRCPAA